MINKTDIEINKNKINNYASNNVPFIFIIDFDLSKLKIYKIDEIDNNQIMFDIDGFKNYKRSVKLNKKIVIKKDPTDFDNYKKSFKQVMDDFYKGNSFLLNLTCPTKVDINLSMKDIFLQSKAKYKLYFKDRFVVFSPETFVKIKDNKISSYPMKGTIDNSIPDAKNIIINNEKEYAEHITIVDLIRNDISLIAKEVEVEKFRYIEKIKTHEKELLQISSKITGKLEKDYKSRLGDIIYSMLPAGSISGAPKKKVLEIINRVENYKRGYYTGIFGYFDGHNLDSSVMIRYIEKINDEYYYKSGGGITVYSDPEAEYKEMIDKVYVPIN